MPSQRHQKEYRAHTVYRITHEALNDLLFFRDADDYKTLIKLLRRYVSPTPLYDATGRKYKSYDGKVTLLAYALVDDRIELLLRQLDEATTISSFMHSLASAYLRYYNRKYERRGPLFYDRFQATIIEHEDALPVSIDVHRLTQRVGKNGFSSLPYYLQTQPDDFIYTDIINNLCRDRRYADML